jgi:hypothetical protein
VGRHGALRSERTSHAKDGADPARQRGYVKPSAEERARRFNADWLRKYEYRAWAVDRYCDEAAINQTGRRILQGILRWQYDRRIPYYEPQCHPLSRLMEWTGRSAGTISRARRRLVEAGVLSYTPGTPGYPGQAAKYQVVVPLYVDVTQPTNMERNYPHLECLERLDPQDNAIQTAECTHIPRSDPCTCTKEEQTARGICVHSLMSSGQINRPHSDTCHRIHDLVCDIVRLPEELRPHTGILAASCVTVLHPHSLGCVRRYVESLHDAMESGHSRLTIPGALSALRHLPYRPAAPNENGTPGTTPVEATTRADSPSHENLQTELCCLDSQPGARSPTAAAGNANTLPECEPTSTPPPLGILSESKSRQVRALADRLGKTMVGNSLSASATPATVGDAAEAPSDD